MSLIQVELPDAALEQARRLAQRKHQSVDQVIADAIQAIAVHDDQLAQFRARVERGQAVSRERFMEILHKAPEVPPVPGDELPG